MKPPNLLLATMLLLAGCKNHQGGCDLAGVATASALVVALPLAPLAASYHTVNQTGKKLEMDKQYLMDVLDPVYAEKIRLIQERSPAEDALALVDQGVVVYLSSHTGSKPDFARYTVYPGVWGLGDDLIEAVDHEANNERVMGNELSRCLRNLINKDPYHESLAADRSNLYLSDTYRAFIAARFDYIERFNLAVFRSIQSGESL